jgi:hypothetical protein
MPPVAIGVVVAVNRRMRTFALVAITVLSGCNLFFDDGGKRPIECTDVATSKAEPDSEPALPPLRDPDHLSCQSFGGSTCNPECGECPPQSDLAPIPTWGVCGSFCESLTESDCAASSECRVVKDAACMISEDCITDFMGCFPIDTTPDPNVDCFAARDGWTCSRSAACSALHERGSCPSPDHPACSRLFATCVPEGESPGKCHDPVVCDKAPPACQNGTLPGVANGCYTGGCIPFSVCENSV